MTGKPEIARRHIKLVGTGSNLRRPEKALTALGTSRFLKSYGWQVDAGRLIVKTDSHERHRVHDMQTLF
jgi:hypothetical protein